MRITRVELTNIKSYQRAVIPFLPGTLAIRGRNGAGKSTLVEAIGYALFGAISYKQAQFVREGEKSGQIVVAFISALDDREYEVVRRVGSSSDWYVMDPELGSHPAEQTADVIDFLRDHLRLEGDLKLDTFFNDALGVAQGTFTADFLMQPAIRKKKFDALLQVEDYRAAFEKLNETRTWLDSERKEQEHRIERLEDETGKLDGWRDQVRQRHLQLRWLGGEIERLQREINRQQERRAQLQQQESEVRQLENAVTQADATRRNAAARLDEATTRRDEALRAQRILVETGADHQAYLLAEQQSKAARERQRQRNDLLGKQNEEVRRRDKAVNAAEHAQTALKQAEAAAQRIAALLPLTERQNILERDRDQAQQDARRLRELDATLAKTRQQHAATQQEIAKKEQAIAACEAARPEAEKLAERRTHLEALQAAAATRALSERRLHAIADERAQTSAAYTDAQVKATNAAEKARKVQAMREHVERLPALEAECEQAETEQRGIEVAIEHHRQARSQSGMGHCPFLREPCLNIQKRGENSLATYFDRLIAESETQLAPIQQRLKGLVARREKLREMQTHYSQLESYQEQAQVAQATVAQHAATLTRLADEQREIEAALANAPTAQALNDAHSLCDRSGKASLLLATLPAHTEELGKAQARLATLAVDLDDLEKQQSALADARTREAAAQDALTQLGDPRGESLKLSSVANERTAHEQKLLSAQELLHTLDAALDTLARQLLPYATLDDELAALEATLTRTQNNHLTYLRHEQIAGQVGERQAAHAAAEHAMQTEQANYAAVDKAYQAARAEFDPNALQQAHTLVEQLNAKHGERRTQREHTQGEIDTLEQEIARVEGLLDDLRAAREERQTLIDLEGMLKQFRETIKEAGPGIMRAVLRQVSVEANRIFGEIMGDRSSQLSWRDDYEVTLTRDGRDRSFAQLSGGEQMSAALAVRLALLRHLSRLDIAFFDEPTQNMDDERRGNLAEQIRRVRGFEQLIVISHDDTFEQGLDSVIHLEKRNGATQLIGADTEEAPEGEMALLAIG